MIKKGLPRNPQFFLLVGLFFMIIGCSSDKGSQPPTIPGSSDIAPPAASQDKVVNRTIIGTDGGIINLDWFVLEFPPDTLTEYALIEISESHLTPRREGIIAGGTPMHVSIQPVSSFPVAHHDGESLIADNAYYTCFYHLNRLPENTGDFSINNQFVDITFEWLETGLLRTGNAWAVRDIDVLSHKLNLGEITIAVIDYSQIPEFTAEPIFTDDPRELTGHYSRYAQGVPFDADNLGPVCGRTPVILIHGLDLENLFSEPNLDDAQALHGVGSWDLMLEVLKDQNLNHLYKEFKFFWYCYPSGQPVFGSSGNGAKLKDKVDEWVEETDETLGEQKIIIIAHSMGGLVARDFMQNQGGNVYRILSVCTPHYGTPFVNILYELNPAQAPGILDLGCYETFEYQQDGQTHTASALNPGLAALNANFSENDPRLICYGVARPFEPPVKFEPPYNEVEDIHWFGLQFLKWVTAPEWLCEASFAYNDGNEDIFLHSDCWVPWRSQFYKKHSDYTQDEDFFHTALTGYHMTAFHDGYLLAHIYLMLILARQELVAEIGVVEFPDPALDQRIRVSIGKPDGEINKKDLLCLESFWTSEDGVYDLEGLQYCTNLTFLQISFEQITNISLIHELTKLDALCISFNSLLSDISPLQGLYLLDDLRMGGCPISDISVLQDLPNLRYIHLMGCEISNIYPLVANPGLGPGDEVVLLSNPLSETSIEIYIPQLEEKGVTVWWF